MSYELGQKVRRVSADYANGRRGEVVEIGPGGARYRVRWIGLTDGRVPASPVNLRTWVRPEGLAPVTPATLIRISDQGTSTLLSITGGVMTVVDAGGCDAGDALAGIDWTQPVGSLLAAIREAWEVGYDGDTDDIVVRLV